MAQAEITRQEPQSLAQPSTSVQEVTPPVDIYENDTEYLLVADLPGVPADGLRVEYQPPELVIAGERKLNGGPVVRYTRTFQLDHRIDPDGIAAELKSGVLTVKLPKSAASRPRKISVRSAA